MRKNCEFLLTPQPHNPIKTFNHKAFLSSATTRKQPSTTKPPFPTSKHHSNDLSLFLRRTSSIASHKKKHVAAFINQNVLHNFRSPNLNNYISFSLNYSKGIFNGILGEAPFSCTSSFRSVIAKVVHRKGKNRRSIFTSYFWRIVSKILLSPSSVLDSYLDDDMDTLSLNFSNKILRIRNRYVFEKDWHNLEIDNWGCPPKKRIKLLHNQLVWEDIHSSILMNYGDMLMPELEKTFGRQIGIVGNHCIHDNTVSWDSAEQWSNGDDHEKEPSSHLLNFIDAFDVGDSSSNLFDSSHVDPEGGVLSHSLNFANTFKAWGTELVDDQTKRGTTTHPILFDQSLSATIQPNINHKGLQFEDLLEQKKGEFRNKSSRTNKKRLLEVEQVELLKTCFSKDVRGVKRKRLWDDVPKKSTRIGPCRKKANINGKKLKINDSPFTFQYELERSVMKRKFEQVHDARNMRYGDSTYETFIRLKRRRSNAMDNEGLNQIDNFLRNLDRSGIQFTSQVKVYTCINYDNNICCAMSFHKCFKKILVVIYILTRLSAKDFCFSRTILDNIKNSWIFRDTDHESIALLVCSCQIRFSMWLQLVTSIYRHDFILCRTNLDNFKNS